MAKSFAITTTATQLLRADAKGHAQAIFTVTNTTARPVRGLAKPKPLGDTKREWLSLEGEAERDFAAGATHQFTVNFDSPIPEASAVTVIGSTAPPAIGAPVTTAAPPRKYSFRLDVESAQNPDEDFVEGPVVTVEVAAKTVVPAKKFPVWIVFVVLGVLLLVGGVVLFFVIRNRGTKEEVVTGPSPTPTAETSPTPETPASPTPVSPIFQVTETTLKGSALRQGAPCRTTVNFVGSISVNASGTVTYTFVRSNGTIDPNRTLTFDAAGKKTVNAEWRFRGLAIPFHLATPFRGWMKILILSPNRMESRVANFICQN